MSTSLSAKLLEAIEFLRRRARFEDWIWPHFADPLHQFWPMLLSGRSHLRDLSQGAGSLCILAVILARHSSVCGCPTNRQPSQLNVAPCWDTFFFVMWMRLLCSSFSGSHHSRFSHNFGVRHRNVCDMCSRSVINFHTSRHNRCIAAHDVLSRPASFSSGPPVLCGFKRPCSLNCTTCLRCVAELS